MKKLSFFLMALLMSLGLVSISHALIYNGGFETGDFSGWSLSIPSEVVFGNPPYNLPIGTAQVVSSFLSPGHGDLRQPVEGHQFAALATGNNGLQHEPCVVCDITLSSVISLHGGETLSGWSFLYNGDYEEQDSAWVRIYDSGGVVISNPWLEISGQASSVPYLSTTPWTHWEWSAPADGSYRLVLGASTFGDNRFSTTAGFDDIDINTVPEPSTLLLLGSGLAGLGGMVWRRNRKS